MPDVLEQLEREGRRRRADARAARKAATAEQRAQAKRNIRNGRRAENRVASYFGGERVPLSGRLGGKYAGDVILAGGLRVEVKRRKGLPPTMLLRWLEQGGADLLVLLGPGQPVEGGLVVMRPEMAKRFVDLLAWAKDRLGVGADGCGDS